MSAKKTLEALRQYEINTYLGFSDIMSYDIGTNFNSIELHTKTKMPSITYYQIFIKAN